MLNHECFFIFLLIHFSDFCYMGINCKWKTSDVFTSFFNKKVGIFHTSCGWTDPIESHVPYSEGTVACGSPWSSVPKGQLSLPGLEGTWELADFWSREQCLWEASKRSFSLKEPVYFLDTQPLSALWEPHLLKSSLPHTLCFSQGVLLPTV